eukprot:5030140-Pleurochrysis_carterae.AAC.4
MATKAAKNEPAKCWRRPGESQISPIDSIVRAKSPNIAWKRNCDILNCHTVNGSDVSCKGDELILGSLTPLDLSESKALVVCRSEHPELLSQGVFPLISKTPPRKANGIAERRSRIQHNVSTDTVDS